MATVSSYGRMRLASDGAVLPAQDLLYHAVQKANAAVYATAQQDPELTGMGATLVALCLQGSAGCVANIGDSRAYLLRDGGCVQITQDHSLVAEQVRLGILTPEMAAVSPLATTITRALGVAPEVEPDLFAAELLSGDRILLTTDGLMRHVSDVEIADLVRSSRDLASACETLIDLTKQRGAIDNVTCLLIEVGRSAAPTLR